MKTFALVKDNIVIGIESHKTKPFFRSFEVVEFSDDIKVIEGMHYDNGSFSNLAFDLEKEKTKLISMVDTKAQWAFNQLDIKFKYTHERGIASILGQEFLNSKSDSSSPMPLTGIYANNKNKSLEEQSKKVERIVIFEVKAAAIIEDLIGSIQDATTENIPLIKKKIEAINDIDSIDGFMNMIAGA